ncbi:MAG: 4-hydroxythreonine-4-phosphate dehydrogenase, partial [Nitrospirae bacterium]
MGDAGGVGPEVALKAASREDLRSLASMVLIGDRRVFEEASRACGLSIEGIEIKEVCTLEEFQKGKPTASSGRAAFECIKRALDGCLKGEFDAMVTAPISKEALRMAG